MINDILKNNLGPTSVPIQLMALDLTSQLYHQTPVLLPIDGFNQTVGGIRMAEMSILIGHTGTGKSTFARNLCLWAAMTGVKTMYMGFEDTDEQIKLKIIETMYKKQIIKPGERPLIPQKEFEELVEELENETIFNGKLKFLDKEVKDIRKKGYFTLKEIVSILKQEALAGTKVFVLDHLHYFIDTASGRPDRQLLDEAVREISLQARELKIHILLVCHPSKLEQRRDGTYVDVGIYSAKGASSISQECHNYWTIKREVFNSYGKNYNIAVLNVLKNRRFGTTGKVLMMVADNGSYYYPPTKEMIEAYNEK